MFVQAPKPVRQTKELKIRTTSMCRYATSRSLHPLDTAGYVAPPVRNPKLLAQAFIQIASQPIHEFLHRARAIVDLDIAPRPKASNPHSQTQI
jgi:hypothetical protein